MRAGRRFCAIYCTAAGLHSSAGLLRPNAYANSNQPQQRQVFVMFLVAQQLLRLYAGRVPDRHAAAPINPDDPCAANGFFRLRRPGTRQWKETLQVNGGLKISSTIVNQTPLGPARCLDLVCAPEDIRIANIQIR